MATMSVWLNYKNPLVRDLAWAIGSPALITSNPQHLLQNHLAGDAQTPAASCNYWPEPSWFETQLQAYLPALDQLERNPEPLAAILKALKSPRLGIYFEALLTYWLATSERYLLLQRNLPIRAINSASGHQTTIGEFDFIVLDKLTNKTLHWEVAIKYYLGLGNIEYPWQWFGPNKKDRLDLKLKHLLHKQTKLSNHPASKKTLDNLGIQIDETWVILKGYLFYPFNSPTQRPAFLSQSHLRGDWQKASEFERCEEVQQWKKLDRKQWLCEHENIFLNTAVNNCSYTSPTHSSEYYTNINNKTTSQRRFIVPDLWF